MRSGSPRCHTVQGINVEMHEVAELPGVYAVVTKQQTLAQITFSRASGENRWYCGAAGCLYEAHKLPVVLSHIVGGHSTLSQRPTLASVGGGVGDFRLGGKHPDPTYEQAIRLICGHRW